MGCSLFDVIEVPFSDLIEEINHASLSIVRISPLQRLERPVTINQGKISIDAIPEVGPMCITLRCCQDNVVKTEVPGIDVDPSISLRGGPFLFKAIGHELNLRKPWDGDELFESNEVAKEAGAHLLRIVIGKIKREPLADQIRFSKDRCEADECLLKEVFIRNDQTHKEPYRMRFFRFTHPAPIKDQWFIQNERCS